MGMFKSLVFKVRKDLESKRTIEEDIQQRSVLSVISQKGSTEGNSHLTEEPIIEEIDSPVVNDCDTSKVPRTLDREQGEQEQQLLSKEQKMQDTEITSSTVAPVAPVASTKAPPKEPAPEPAPQASEDKKCSLMLLITCTSM